MKINKLPFANDFSENIEIPSIPKELMLAEQLQISAPSESIQAIVNGAIDSIEMLNNSINEQTYEMLESINSAVNLFTTAALSQIVEGITALVDVSRAFEFPTLTDEEVEQLVESNRIWGRCGWTYSPSMVVGVFDYPPENTKEADRIVARYCNDYEMDRVFMILQSRKLNHKDLESAIFCYKSRQYKACALLLCGIIDSRLIQLRKDNKRPVGEKAIKQLITNFDAIGNRFLFEVMQFNNLLAYLETLFANGRGFKKEPVTLNRNYIGHGMNRRTVRKRDCIQLFFALNNLMRFLK